MAALGSAAGRLLSVAEDFWSALTPDAAQALTARGTARTFARGRALFHEGQLPDQVMLLRAGRVKVAVATAAGREVVLAFRGPGELVGEQSAIDGEPRSASIVAVEEVEALVLTHHGVPRVPDRATPPAALALLRILSRRLREADEKRIEFSTFTTMRRGMAGPAELLETGADRFSRERSGDVAGGRRSAPSVVAGPAPTGPPLSGERAPGTMRSS